MLLISNMHYNYIVNKALNILCQCANYARRLDSCRFADLFTLQSPKPSLITATDINNSAL